MAHCGFKTEIEYYDERIGENVTYTCLEPKENILDTGLCIFHDKNYLKDPENKEANEQNIKKKLSEKLAKSEPLICIGYRLPDFSFENRRFDKSVSFSQSVFVGPVNFSEAQFTKEADFRGAQFTEKADFSKAQFTKEADFTEAQFTKEAYFIEAQFTGANFYKAQFTGAHFYNTQFTGEADFYKAQFTGEANFTGAYIKEAVFSKTHFKEAVFYKTQFADKADFSEIESTSEEACPHLDFHNVQFDIPEHITFLTDDLSEVSFVNTDITRVRFGEDVVWGDRFKIREEREIENQLETKKFATDIQLGDILAVYRNLRENYEFRMRYAEAGEFFIREMEINRLYRQDIKNGHSRIRRNYWITQNYSFTGIYYHISRYSQSLLRPALFGISAVMFSILLMLTQSNPAADFSVSNITIPTIATIPTNNTITNSTTTNLEIAIERTLTNFLSGFSPTGLNASLTASDIISGGITFYGAITFFLFFIALRRKFERKFRH